MLITNNQAYAERSKLLRSHGMTTLSYERSKGHSTSYDVVELGYNYRMDDIRASIGIVQLGKLQDDLNKRSQIRKKYLKELSKIDELIIPFINYNGFSSNYIFPIVLKNSTYNFRENVRKNLSEAGIQSSVHYPAIHRFSIYKQYYRCLPVTEYVADNLITLPMYSKLNNEMIEHIVDSLKKALK